MHMHLSEGEVEGLDAFEILELIASGLIFIYMAFGYFPLMKESFKLSDRIEEELYKKALRSIRFMAVFLFSIFFFLLLDKIVIIMG